MIYSSGLFWVLVGLVGYTYLGYGVVLFVAIRIKRIFRSSGVPQDPDPWPSVTLVIPCYNEKSVLAEKLQNTRQLDYPSDRLTVVFITDGSTDGSQEYLRAQSDVVSLHQPVRAGKSAAENRAMQFIQTPYVVFCDANTWLNPESIKRLVRHYQDPKVGGVSGEKRVKMDGTTEAEGEGLYWKYESTLKRWDSELWSLVGAAGELVSFRTDLFEPLEEDTILDDFVQSMRIAQKGYRFLYEPEAYAMESSSAHFSEEFKRKVRIAAGGWQAMSRLGFILNPLRQPLLSWMYVSHRVLRWSIAAFALPLLLVLNAFLASQGNLYLGLLIGQGGFYVLAAKGWLDAQKGKKGIGYVPFYFCFMNYAVIAGFYRWLNKRQSAVWERAQRKA
ncbi:glycosyltransferase [bacterium]|nr:glycosyltransferase [bacterium]